jgi:hypothetical protein
VLCGIRAGCDRGLASCGLLFARGAPGARTCALLTMAVLGELPAVAGLGWIAWKAAASGRPS